MILLFPGRPRLPQAFAAAADDVTDTGWPNMCPVGTVAGEIADGARRPAQPAGEHEGAARGRQQPAAGS